MKTIDELWKLLKNVELIQVHPSEMELLYKHCFEFKKPNIVEVGSAHGASSIILAEAAKELGGRLYCIDNFPEDYYGQEKFGSYGRKAFLKNVKTYIDDGRQTLFYIDGTSGTFGEVTEIVQDAKIDVLFIDGDHSYDGVKTDCLNLLPMLAPGGYVGFHDYNNPEFGGVKRAADEFTGNWETESEWDLIVRQKP